MGKHAQSHAQQTAASEAAGAARPAKKKKRSLPGIVWILLGIVTLLYPIVATLYNDYQQDKRAESYADKVEQIEPDERTREYLDGAHEYNDWLDAQGHHAMPPEPGSPGFDRYMKTLDAPETDGVIARLRIPSIDVDLPVYHTTHSSVLYNGAGHMFGSDLPVGGKGTNSVISAHTGMVDASMFDNLPRIKDGADVYVEVMGQRLRYTITGRVVVRPGDYDAVTYEQDRDKLTLITCTPYGLNTNRLLVVADRADPVGDADKGGWRPTLSWWMILDLLVILIVLLIIAYREWKKRRKNKDAES